MILLIILIFFILLNEIFRLIIFGTSISSEFLEDLGLERILRIYFKLINFL